MITAEESKRLADLLGDLPRTAGMEERMLGGEQMHHFIADLVDKMDELGITQAELGRRMGVDRRQILRWVRADGSLKADTMFALARHVGYRLNMRWVPVESTTSVQTEPGPSMTLAAPTTVLRTTVRGLPTASASQDEAA